MPSGWLYSDGNALSFGILEELQEPNSSMHH